MTALEEAEIHSAIVGTCDCVSSDSAIITMFSGYHRSILPKGDHSAGMCVQNDLQQDGRVVGRRSNLAVAVVRHECRQIELVVDQVIERVLKSAGQDLAVERYLAGAGSTHNSALCPGHPQLSERVSGLRGSSHHTEAQSIEVGRLFL